MDDTHLAVGEKDSLARFLDDVRAGVVWKVQGISDDDARRPRTDSGTSLGGLVKHLAWVERGWFRHRLLGEEIDPPWTDEDPDADMRMEADETLAEVLALYATACDESRAAFDGRDLDDVTVNHPARGPVTLRWIALHLIDETARHCGHLDILREQLDGVTGDERP